MPRQCFHSVAKRAAVSVLMVSTERGSRIGTPCVIGYRQPSCLQTRAPAMTWPSSEELSSLRSRDAWQSGHERYESAWVSIGLSDLLDLVGRTFHESLQASVV